MIYIERLVIIINVFLSGAIKFTDDYGKTWRNIAEKQLKDYDIKVFSPSNYYNYNNKQDFTIKECRKLFLNHLRKSDIVLVNLNYSSSSVGTGMEISLANELKIPIVGFGNLNTYEWIVDCCDVVLKDIYDAIDYIKSMYCY